MAHCIVSSKWSSRERHSLMSSFRPPLVHASRLSYSVLPSLSLPFQILVYVPRTIPIPRLLFQPRVFRQCVLDAYNSLPFHLISWASPRLCTYIWLVILNTFAVIELCVQRDRVITHSFHYDSQISPKVLTDSFVLSIATYSTYSTEHKESIPGQKASNHF